jgi:hypothetical protein
VVAGGAKLGVAAGGVSAQAAVASTAATTPSDLIGLTAT